MMRTGLSLLGCPREHALIVGDRMDTDIISGIEAGHRDRSGTLRRDATR
jgi:NagD protein